MASKREQVADAVKALIQSALPMADVRRNESKGPRVTPGGYVNLLDGDPGPAEETLGLRTWGYDHRFALEVIAYPSDELTREQVVDQMLGQIGLAVQADRFLGGLCEYLDVEAPTGSDMEVSGVQPARLADAVIVASYVTSDPLN